MLRKMGYSLFSATVLLSTSTFAIQSLHILTNGKPLIPNETLILNNMYNGKIKLDCLLKTNGINNVEILVKRETVTVNNLKISAGQTHTRPVSDGTRIILAAEERAIMWITNRGLETVEAQCTFEPV